MKVFVGILTFCLVGCSLANVFDDEIWNDFKSKHGKIYDLVEEKFRFMIFNENQRRYEELTVEVKSTERILNENADKLLSELLKNDIEEDTLILPWNTFMSTYNKNYQDSREAYFRRKIYEDNLEYIKNHNDRYAKGEESILLGANEYTDMLHSEFIETMTAHKTIPYNISDSIEQDIEEFSIIDLPKLVDWRKQGAVTPVKNQGRCGSCWAFGSTGVLEAQMFKKTHRLVSLSEQNLVDCSHKNHGCNGGWPMRALQYVQSNGGLDTASSYPYEGRDARCRYNKRNSAANVEAVKSIPFGNERLLQQIVSTVGPVAVAVDANPRTFSMYRGGIFDERRCSKTRTNHIILVVGYGTENGKDYWLVKNSWGTSWGEQGYVRFRRNQNVCGIASYPVYALS